MLFFSKRSHFIQDWVHVILFSDTASDKAAVKMFNLIATKKSLVYLQQILVLICQ